MRFADDTVLINEKRSRIEIMLNELVAYSAKTGLQINISKNKFTSNILSIKIFLGDVEIEKQDEYIYHGQTTSFKSKVNKKLEIKRTKT